MQYNRLKFKSVSLSLRLTGHSFQRLVTANQLNQLFFATNQAITRSENNTLIPNIKYVKDAVSTRT
jgi:hypothetical protein